MADFVYPPMVAYDKETIEPLRSGGTGTITAIDGTPTEITDLAGVPITEVVIDEYALTQPFIAQVPECYWVSGDMQVYLFSPRGILDAALDAVDRAELAEQQLVQNVETLVTGLINNEDSSVRAALVTLIGLVAPGGGGGTGDAQKSEVASTRVKDEVSGTWPARAEGYAYDIAVGSDPPPSDAVIGDQHEIPVD